MKFTGLSVLTVSPDSWDKTFSVSEWEHDIYCLETCYYKKVRPAGQFFLVLNFKF